MPSFKQLPLTIDQQIELLKQKKLIIPDEEYAKYWLSHVSYYRLKHYTFSFKDINDNHNFIPNTTFDQVLQLYLFDRKLKLVIFDGLETIEVAIKTMLSNTLSQAYGAHWYMEQTMFSEKFEYEKFIKTIEDEFDDPDENSVKVYKTVYTDPTLPPSWMVMELLTFGTVSKIFEHIQARQEKQDICWHFNLPDNILMSWLHCFTHMRNRCAHHSRFVYRSVKHEPILPSRRKHIFLDEVDSINRSSLYAALCCMQHLISKINVDSSFKSDLLSLIELNPQINYSHMGFTENWRKEKIWQ
jgi:abortive infection bacteriophage resistance protein